MEGRELLISMRSRTCIHDPRQLRCVQLQASSLSAWTFPVGVKLVLLGYAFLGALAMTALVAALIVYGHFSLQMYTYWNLLLVWLFFVWLGLGVLLEGTPLKLLTLFFWPLVSASSFLVAVLIVLIVNDDGWMFIGGTTYGTGSASVGMVHTGDELIHPLPLLLLLGALPSGYLFYARSILSWYFCRELNCLGRILYCLYWFGAALLTLIPYIILNDPMRRYPTDHPLGTWVLIVAILILGFQSLNLLWMLSAGGHNIAVPSFARMCPCVAALIGCHKPYSVPAGPMRALLPAFPGHGAGAAAAVSEGGHKHVELGSWRV